MAAPSYTTDLAVIHSCDTGGTWAEPTGFAGGAITNPETDYFIQNTGCISKNCGTSAPIGTGAMVNFGSGVTIPSPGAVMTWIFFGAPNTLAVQNPGGGANGGLQVFVGSASTAFKQWFVRGSDTYAYGGWICVPVDPSVTADLTTGSPSATRQWFGAGAYIPGPGIASKGNPFGLDCIRYGRGEARMNGGDLANGYATFTGYAAQNDAVANRWGLIQAVSGGYQIQGLVIFGYSSAVDFRDSNTSILIANTEKVVSGFNAFEVRQAGSRVEMASISFLALGTVSRGNWITTDNATIILTACTFTKMGTFGFLSNSTITDCTFRQCDQITGGGGTFDTCAITNSRAAVSLVLTNLNQATDCTFTSDGSNHAVDLGTISSSVSMNWNNYLSGYAVSNGSTGNEAIKVNVAASQILTINVGAGYSTPSIYNTGTGTVNVVSGQVTTSINVKSLSNGSNISGARVLIWATDASNKFYNASVAITGSGTTATVTHTGHGLATGDYVIISGVTNDDDYNGVHQITKINDNSYSYTADDTLTSPASGTIVAKWAILSGTTDSNGYIEDIRSFGSAQPIQGWVRMTSGSPYYQQGVISGTVNTSNGFSVTVQLASDE